MNTAGTTPSVNDRGKTRSRWKALFAVRPLKAASLLAAVIVLALLAAACGPAATPAPAPAHVTVPAAPVIPTATQPPAPTDAPAAGPVNIESGGEVPFYARFGQNETFSDGEWVVIIFYRPPDCIPADYNMQQFFHFPGEAGPGAFGCTPPTTLSYEVWANGPETDPAPLVSEMTGRGEVPVWFITQDEVFAAQADGEVTIAELASLPSRRVGTATEYEELLHPSQSNAETLIRFTAEGQLEDGGGFSVSVSYGDPTVANHTAIDLGQ